MSRVVLILSKFGIETVRRGKRLWAKCPYHDDKDPSWFIRDEGERYGQHWCFSCEAGGSLTELVMHLKKLDYDDARAWIQDVIGGEDEPEKEPAPPAASVNVQSIQSKRFSLPRECIMDPFYEWVSPAKKYIWSRGITEGQVARWNLGYAVDGRLRGRIIIPVWGSDGLPKSYTARSFGDHEKRYLFSQEEENHDLNVSFGEHLWSKNKREIVIVTEGAIDSLTCERVFEHVELSGIAVDSLSGSHVRPMFIQKMSTFKGVIVMTDDDKAGNLAAEELKCGLTRYTHVVRVRLPQGKDATSLPPDELKSILWPVIEDLRATLANSAQVRTEAGSATRRSYAR